MRNTFDCGQCFRFNEQEDKSFIGVAFGKPVCFSEEENGIYIDNITPDEFNEKWLKFLDFERNYKIIKEKLSVDETMKKAIEFGGGIRILRQEFSECVISFIISQQNNIPKIKKAVEGFCRLFGEKISYMGNDYYTFPRIETIKNITVSDLEPLKIGYRDKYIIDAIEKLNSGFLNCDELEKMSYKDAKERLLKVHGIGNKVADCILLFSLGKFDAFPTDTWIKKAMMELYGVDEKNIEKYSKANFGEYSGFAQQYIFYYMRWNKAK
ncbi:MAG: DNA-3-methyladenine glycosylase 2 family protein [Clostridia bacterium]|nr:DNA-3-methyladenine glycosylase 2 family protein [Clostridia bacterium]